MHILEHIFYTCYYLRNYLCEKVKFEKAKCFLVLNVQKSFSYFFYINHIYVYYVVIKV